MKKLEQSNEELHREIAKRDKGIDDLKVQMRHMQEQHGRQIRNLQGIHNQELEAKDKEISRGKVVRSYRLHQRNDREPSDEERNHQVQWQDLFRRTQTEV